MNKLNVKLLHNIEIRFTNEVAYITQKNFVCIITSLSCLSKFYV